MTKINYAHKKCESFGSWSDLEVHGRYMFMAAICHRTDDTENTKPGKGLITNPTDQQCRLQGARVQPLQRVASLHKNSSSYSVPKNLLSSFQPFDYLLTNILDVYCFMTSIFSSHSAASLATATAAKNLYNIL